jgi:hypothetical protein
MQHQKISLNRANLIYKRISDELSDIAQLHDSNFFQKKDQKWKDTVRLI